MNDVNIVFALLLLFGFMGAMARFTAGEAEKLVEMLARIHE